MRLVRLRTVLASGLTFSCAGCELSISAEDELGDRYAEAIAAQLPLIADSGVTARVAAIGNRLASVADDASRDWHFYVVDDTVMNAFAVPGGHIFVYRGLIERAGSMSEFAGVLGHEVAHVTLRHSIDQLRSRTRTNVLLALFCSITGFCGSTVAQVAINVGGEALFAGHSRADESEADSAAVGYLVQAGIDPRGLPAMFRRMGESRTSSPGAIEGWFASHPDDGDRVARTAQLTALYSGAELDRLARTGAGFEDLQERLRAVSGKSRDSR